MSGPGRPTVEARLSRGQSQACAHSHHDRCLEAESCTCDCHRDPAAAAARREAAQRAYQTRLQRGEPPLRPKGRSESPSAPKETAPKRPAIATGKKPVIPAAAAKQIKSGFGFALWSVDGVCAGAERIPQWTPEDRLQPAELSGLVDATYNEIEARAPWLLKYLAKVGESAPEAALVYTVAMIALPRLARREAVIMGVKITPEFARAVVIAPLIAQSVGQQTSATMGAESAPVSDRPDRNGQVDVGGAPAEAAPVQAGAAQQTGFGDVRHGPSHQNGAWNSGHSA